MFMQDAKRVVNRFITVTHALIDLLFMGERNNYIKFSKRFV